MRRHAAVPQVHLAKRVVVSVVVVNPVKRVAANVVVANPAAVANVAAVEAAGSKQKDGSREF
jgi:hypothetical protein